MSRLAEKDLIPNMSKSRLLRLMNFNYSLFSLRSSSDWLRVLFSISKSKMLLRKVRSWSSPSLWNR